MIIEEDRALQSSIQATEREVSQTRSKMSTLTEAKVEGPRTGSKVVDPTLDCCWGEVQGSVSAGDKILM